MTYQGLVNQTSTASPHLGGNIKVGDPLTFSPSAWNYLLQRFCVESVLDLGCGIGNAAHFFAKSGVKVVAVDGLPENIKSPIFPILEIDLTKQSVSTRVDLVHCQEVVEHVEEKYVMNIIKSFQSGKFVCMTHAFPGQGGYHHVNEQPSEYWINIMTKSGFTLLPVDSNRVRQLAKRDGAKYLCESGLIFTNKMN